MWPNARQIWSPFVLLYWGRPGSTEWIGVASPLFFLFTTPYMHAQGLRRDKIGDYALVIMSYISSLNDKWAACLLRTAVISIASFEDRFSTLTCVHSCQTTCTQRIVRSEKHWIIIAGTGSKLASDGRLQRAKIRSSTVLVSMRFLKVVLRQDPPPLDLSFWSFLTFLHHGIEKVDMHLLWKFHKKIQRKSWSNVPPKLLTCIGFLYKVVHKNGRLRKFNGAREI